MVKILFVYSPSLSLSFLSPPSPIPYLPLLCLSLSCRFVNDTQGQPLSRIQDCRCVGSQFNSAITGWCWWYYKVQQQWLSHYSADLPFDSRTHHPHNPHQQNKIPVS